MSIRRFLAASLATAAATLGLMAPAAPAAAKPVATWGFAYFDNPSPLSWVTLDPSRQWGTWKTSFPADFATGIKVAAGRYYVRYPHLATGGIGIAHVTAVDRAGHYCQVAKTFDRGRDLIVDVACFAPGGAPDDARFSVLFTVGSGSGYPSAPGGYAFLTYGPGGIVQVDNSTGAANSAGPISTGQYQVKLPGVGERTGRTSGNLQVTAAGSVPTRCKIAKWGQTGADVLAYVFCFDALGSPADSAFYLSYHRERAVVATYPPKYFGYVWTPDMTGATNFNNPIGFGANSLAPVVGLPGYAAVRFPQLAAAETHAQITASGGDPGYCNIASAWDTAVAPSNAVLPVVCFDKTGRPAAQRFLATFTARY